MDYLRSCYRSSMRLYPDRPDILTAGRWYFCPDGAKDIPYNHRFASSVWDPGGFDPPTDLGEVLPRGPWTNGVAPSWATGQHFCGARDVWERGLPYADRPGLLLDAQGRPQCCAAPREPQWNAGVTFDGRYTAWRSLQVWAALSFSTARPPTAAVLLAHLGLTFDAGRDDLFSGLSSNGQITLTAAGDNSMAWFDDGYDTDGYLAGTGSDTFATMPTDGVYLVGVELRVFGVGPAVGVQFLQLQLQVLGGSEFAGDIRVLADGTSFTELSLFAARELVFTAGDQVVTSVTYTSLSGSDSTIVTGHIFIDRRGPIP